MDCERLPREGEVAGSCASRYQETEMVPWEAHVFFLFFCFFLFLGPPDVFLLPRHLGKIVEEGNKRDV